MLPWKRVLGPLTALLLAAAAATVPTTAAHADSATTASASGWNDYGCKPSAAHPRPVVLVHGTFGNSIDNWLALAPYLTVRGYCVFSVDYGQLPGVPSSTASAPSTNRPRSSPPSSTRCSPPPAPPRPTSSATRRAA